MTQITNNLNLFSGVSDCGRVVYHECNNGFISIDGRLAYRRQYVIEVPGQICMAADGDVSAADWDLAVTVMRDVDGAKQAHVSARQAWVDDKQRVRDDFYDAMHAAIATKQIIVD
jgi:hypothetical protein